jgi:hypothetical protein
MLRQAACIRAGQPADLIVTLLRSSQGVGWSAYMLIIGRRHIEFLRSLNPLALAGAPLLYLSFRARPIFAASIPALKLPMRSGACCDVPLPKSATTWRQTTFIGLRPTN